MGFSVFSNESLILWYEVQSNLKSPGRYDVGVESKP